MMPRCVASAVSGAGGKPSDQAGQIRPGEVGEPSAQVGDVGQRGGTSAEFTQIGRDGVHRFADIVDADEYLDEGGHEVAGVG